MLKKTAKKLLSYFGYEFRKTNSSTDAFSIQKNMTEPIAPVIFDIGAHVGSTTMEYRRLFPLAFIYCFEPFSQIFDKLLLNVKGDSRISCHKYAVSEKKGAAVLNINLSPATNSLLETDERGSSYWGEHLLDTTSQMKVETTTVDCFCHEKGITHIDILKIDAQGSEYAVFMGAKDMLSKQKISLIYTELIMCPTYKGQRKFYEYLGLMDSFGYEFLDFFNPVKHDSQLIQADIIFSISPTIKK